MKRTNDKISDTIRSGKKPRRKGPRVIAMADIPLGGPEDVELARGRIARLGYVVDQLGILRGRN